VVVQGWEGPQEVVQEVEQEQREQEVERQRKAREVVREAEVGYEGVAVQWPVREAEREREATQEQEAMRKLLRSWPGYTSLFSLLYLLPATATDYPAPSAIQTPTPSIYCAPTIYCSPRFIAIVSYG